MHTAEEELDAALGLNLRLVFCALLLQVLHAHRPGPSPPRKAACGRARLQYMPDETALRDVEDYNSIPQSLTIYSYTKIQ